MFQHIKISDILMSEYSKRYFYKNVLVDEFLTHKTVIMDNIFPISTGDRRRNTYNFRIEDLIHKYFRLNIRRHYSNRYLDYKYPHAYIHAGMINSLPFSALCEILDIDLKSVKKNLCSFHDLVNKNKIGFIGFGGAVCNLLQFIEYFKKETNYKKDIRPDIYEHDNFSFHNMFRIYDHRLLNLSPYNVQPFNEYLMLKVPKSFAVGNGYPFNVKYVLNRNDVNRTIWIGAPDIATREMFNNSEHQKLVLFVHKDHNGYIGQNITVNGLETETYGKINVPILLLNILKMTEKFLKYCDDIKSGAIDEGERDKLVFEFNAVDFLRNKYSKLKANQNEITNNSINTVDFFYKGKTYSIFI